MQTDGKLVARARRGDVGAFDALLRRHYGLAKRIALDFAAIPEDADDLTQEAFVAAFERLGQLTDPDCFSSWLASIVRNQGRMWLRRRLCQPVLCPLDDALPDPAKPTAGSPIREAVIDALSTLNARHRRVVHMHYLQGYDYKETAELLRVSVSTVRGRLDRARETLRKELRHMAREHRGWELTDRDLDAIRAAGTFAFSGEDRTAINTLFFDGQGRIVSTDTCRLFVYSSPSLESVSRALVHADLARVLRDEHPGATRARLALSETEAVLHLDEGKEVRAPLVSEEYPSWENVVPTEFTVKAMARVGDWLEALALLADQRDSGFITNSALRILMVLSPEEGRITLREGQEPPAPEGLSREVGVSFPAQFAGGGPDLIVAVNLCFMQQAISSLGTDADSRVELCAGSEFCPLLTRPADGGRTYVVTMPMQRHSATPVETAPATH